MPEPTKVVRVRDLIDPYRVSARFNLADVIGKGEYAPFTFASDSILMLLSTISNKQLMLNINTQEVTTLADRDGIIVPSNHGTGVYLRNDTTWSYIDCQTRSQRVVATGSYEGTVLGNGDVLLVKEQKMLLFDLGTGNLRATVSLPAQYRILGARDYVALDDVRQKLYIMATDRKILVSDIETGIVQELTTVPGQYAGAIDLSRSGAYLSLADDVGSIYVYNLTTKQWIYSGTVTGYARNVRFVGDTALLLTTDAGLERVNFRSNVPHQAIAVPWRNKGVYLGTAGNFSVTDAGEVLDMNEMVLRRLDIGGVRPVNSGRQFAGIRYTGKESTYVVLDATTLEVVQEYSRSVGDFLIDCDTKSGLTIEETPDTTLLFTNHVAQVSAEYRNPEVLHGQFQARLFPDQTEAMVIADDGGEILNTVTGRPVMQTHFIWGGLYSELMDGVRTFSTKFSSNGDLLYSRGPERAGVISRPDLLLSRSPVFEEVDLFSFYGFTVDDAVAFLTRAGEYVIRDQKMRVAVRYRLTEDTSRQQWASLSSESNRLLVSYQEDRIELYSVERIVSVESEMTEHQSASNLYWPLHTNITIPGTITGVYDDLGRQVINHFSVNSSIDSTTLANSSSLKGLFVIAMANGDVRTVLCR
ncbi:MAG: hypothetical protein ACK5GI_08050 [Ignavibacteria bacterium]